MYAGKTFLVETPTWVFYDVLLVEKKKKSEQHIDLIVFKKKSKRKPD